MSRMGEWFMEWHEDDDLDLMLCELAHEEELHQQELEARRYPVVITPQTFTHESDTCPSKTISGVSGLPGMQQTISVEPSRTPHLRRRFPSIR